MTLVIENEDGSSVDVIINSNSKNSIHDVIVRTSEGTKDGLVRDDDLEKFCIACLVSLGYAIKPL